MVQSFTFRFDSIFRFSGAILHPRSDTEKGTDANIIRAINVNVDEPPLISEDIVPDLSPAEAAALAAGSNTTCATSLVSESVLRAVSAQILWE